MTAYVVADITVTNPDGYAPYRPLAGASVTQYGGRFVARGGAVEPLEGGWNPARVVIIEFPSMDAARKWYHSPEYQEASVFRKAGGEVETVVVEGVGT